MHAVLPTVTAAALQNCLSCKLRFLNSVTTAVGLIELLQRKYPESEGLTLACSALNTVWAVQSEAAQADGLHNACSRHADCQV
jgi:hypothetical protein